MEYWIEEPSFRVHRWTREGRGTRVVVDSEFDHANPGSPFPSHVVAVRVNPELRRETSWTINSFETAVEIPAERFTIKSMNLPVATPVVDYRSSRIVGYWNGDGLSDSPVKARQIPAR